PASASEQPGPSIAYLALCQPLSSDILTEALTAEHRLIYTAQGEIRDGGSRTLLQVWRDGRQDLTRWVYAPPGGDSMVVIQRQDEQWQSEGDGTWLHQDLLPEMLIGFAERLELLISNYEIEPAGEKRIAGRQCWGYNILPKSSGNPSRLMFIDAETYLPLRTENVNGLGDLVSVSAHSEVEYHQSLDAGLFAAPTEGVREDPVERTGPLNHRQAQTESGIPLSEPGYVPEGYRFAGAFIVRQGRSVAVHMQWFDGLSLISLFKQRSAGGVSDDVWTRHHANSVSWSSSGYSYQLMGDIIPAELSRMRDSL
ncbi:MAG: hypothetical protein GF320_21805, partial [Armatimonadia bacterium]|nr:hypothetical protein [Armatimonadia bacterium]